MAYRIDDNCLRCSSCEMDCPSDAVREKEEKFEIDEKACTECGICVYACPVDAVSGPH